MQKSSKIIVGVSAGVLAIAAAIAGPIIYRDMIAAPAAETPSLSAEGDALKTASGEPLDARALAGVWIVSAGSEAGYRVAEVLNGTDVTVTGRTDRVDGSFTLSADGLTLESAEISVQVAAITTDSEQRDAYFREQALRTSEFPTATFVLTKPVSLASPPAAGEVVKAQATGDLTLVGVTRSVTAEVEVRGVAEEGSTTTAASAEIAGSIPVTFSDFGVTAPNLGFVSVDNSGAVEFQLVAKPQG